MIGRDTARRNDPFSELLREALNVLEFRTNMVDRMKQEGVTRPQFSSGYQRKEGNKKASYEYEITF
jgi:hypothetical protein